MSSELTRDTVMKAVFPALDGFAPSSAPASLSAKRALDLVVGIALLLIFAPVMALVALAVTLESPGPILFCQQPHRPGRQDLSAFSNSAPCM